MCRALPPDLRRGGEPLGDGAVDRADDPRHFPALVGTIGISGAWEGTLALSWPFSFAAECGATMHGRPAAELAASEVRDAWGELVNIVGGNLKALLTPPCRLGLRSVEDGATYSYREPQGGSSTSLPSPAGAPESA